MRHVLFASVIITALSASPLQADTREPLVTPPPCPYQIAVYHNETLVCKNMPLPSSIYADVFTILHYEVETIWKYIYRNVLSVEP